MFSAEDILRPKSTLKKGNACITCRRRKMRCDGAKPFCNNCSRTKTPYDCEYTDSHTPTRTKTEEYEQRLADLQSRLRELDPQAPETSSRRRRGHQSVSPSEPNTSQSHGDWWTLPDPPEDITNLLLSVFSEHAEQMNFAFIPRRFQREVLLPPGHPMRPHPALINAVFLWALRFSQQPKLMQLEPIYLNRTVASLPGSLNSQSARAVAHTIQAEVLVAQYLYYCNRFLEGKYHADAAMSLALGNQLHRIDGSPRSSLGNMQGSLRAPELDGVEKSEVISVFWSVFILDKCWSVVLGSSPVFADDFTGSTSISTPLPLAIEDYEDRYAHGSLVGSSGPQFSGLALRARASAMFERATRLISNHVGGQLVGSDFRRDFSAVHNMIMDLVGTVDQIQGSNNPAAAGFRSFSVTYSLAHVAVIQLHNVFAETDSNSFGLRIDAARKILGILDRLSREDLPHMDPILGVTWLAAARVLANQVTSARSGNSYELRESVRATINRIISRMDAWAQICPLLGNQAQSLRALRDTLM